MAQYLDLTPLSSANTNDFGIIFSLTTDSAEVEFKQPPEIIINKNITGVELVSINTAGLVIKKNTLNAIIPWGNIIAFRYL